MPRSYRCKTCGSDQVYHHCVAPRINLATIQKVRKAAVVMAKPVQPVVVPPPQPVQPMKEVNVLTTCQLDGCNNEAKAAISGVKWINGKVMRVQGDRLCAPCYDRLYEAVAAIFIAQMTGMNPTIGQVGFLPILGGNFLHIFCFR